MDAPQTSERLYVPEQVQDQRLLFERRRDHDQQLATRTQPGETDLEIRADRVKLERGQKAMLERLFGEAAQQRTPVIVRTEWMIRSRVLVVRPAGQFLLESIHGFVGPSPVAHQARETVDGRGA